MTTNYRIVTDSSSDLPTQYLQKEGILSIPLSFTIDGKRYYSGEMDAKEFYNRLRNGSFPKTSQVNVEEALQALRPILQAGEDILYIGFSSGMSGTLNSMEIAAEELRCEFPEREIVVVDSLSVTLSQGLLVHLTNLLKNAGTTLDKAAKWAQEHVQNLALFVTTSDLVHLHRGGRISKATTIIGSLLGFQPIISLDDAGKPQVIGRKRGKQNALNSLVEHMKEIVGDAVNSICFITHTDCEQDALYVRDQVEKVFGIKEFMINQAGPVLGTHTGPGAVALAMLANGR